MPGGASTCSPSPRSLGLPCACSFAGCCGVTPSPPPDSSLHPAVTFSTFPRKRGVRWVFLLSLARRSVTVMGASKSGLRADVRIVDLFSDDETEKAGLKAAKLETDFTTGAKQQNKTDKGQVAKHKRSRSHATRQGSEENISSSNQSAGHSNSSVLEQGTSPVDDTRISYASPICAAPLRRQFWKAGSYNMGSVLKSPSKMQKNYLHVNPMFLHSNATSHKRAFGAIAELLDNAVVDEDRSKMGLPLSLQIKL
ncbi:zinc finger protein [Sesbania bispinosa]|nr:zinc finger protein [Sesbania bispinosa]